MLFNMTFNVYDANGTLIAYGIIWRRRRDDGKTNQIKSTFINTGKCKIYQKVLL